MARKQPKQTKVSPPAKPGRVSVLNVYSVVEVVETCQDSGEGRHVPGTPGIEVGKLEKRIGYALVGPGIESGKVVAFGEDGKQILSKKAILANLAYRHGRMLAEKTYGGVGAKSRKH